ncbi:MAG: molybdenum cofactor biosynthesis protein MoaE [Alistipes senegalensis]|nr:molybdenum cofactor biosynthesis protein MoaE [Oxalobacter formigenes]MCM1281151.1 molybdenum cofactor biosynthesis protein MoaE [Alistipes senegalensis]
MSVCIQTGDFDISSELAILRAGNTRIGAVVSFVGTVRDESGGETVFGMELEHYPGMAEQSLTEIELEAARRWPLMATRIVHRVGPLQPGEQIVLVAAAAEHRAAAFEACSFMMDCLKSSAPLWKKETLPSGTRWVEGKTGENG